MIKYDIICYIPQGGVIMTFEEKTLSSERIYEGRILNLRCDEVTTINGTSYREIIEHNGGAAIAALTDERKMVMVRQFRKPSERVMLEVPAGKRDGGESGLEVARRELREETGYSAEFMTHLTSIFTTVGYSEEVLDIYLAEGLMPGETNFDDNEAIDILEIQLDELVDMIMAGKIEDAKSIVAIMMTAEILRRRSDG